MLRLRHPIALLAICLLVMMGVLRSFSAPSPVGADAPDVVFSAIRAEAILRDLLRENVPHVAGSAANAVVRDRIGGHFRSAGYDTELQSRFHCNPAFGSCSPVDNIIAVKPGSEGRHAVLLTAHYDSGWVGPGAADDGAGTAAILEIARMAAEFPPFRNDVIFLISDSEENGLIGADAFARHHALFERVRVVINLEARGVAGPSGMFETGEGNRSIIRIFSKNVGRPVANSLLYEMYQRMPNDTDYSVYREAGVMGLNFAFARGAAAYHSVVDDPDHLSLGSLQHHGDNAWGVLQALAERDLNAITAREDAGYIDLFSLTLIHYPVSIVGGMALFLGVWTMLAIALAFRREFRYRQLRWGVVAIPLFLAAIVAAGYLLSWPLGHWPDLHPLEHPYPWAGRLTLFLTLLLIVYVSVKLLLERVSPCAWMILAWGLIFALGMVLASKMPAAAHIALLPLLMFAFGSLLDLLRRKSPAPLLMASVLGFAAAAFISFYHYFMLDVVMNFDRSHFKLATLCLLALTAMPMLLAYARRLELSWQPARWLLVAVLTGCLIHLFLPGYTAALPRDMTLMYQEVADSGQGHVVLESIYQRHDRQFADKHDFVEVELNDGALGNVTRPARSVSPLDLPGVKVRRQEAAQDGQTTRRRVELELPAGSPLLWLTFPEDAGLEKAWVDDVLALDTGLKTKRARSPSALWIIHPPGEIIQVELQLRAPDPLTAAVVTWHELPGILVAPFMGNWPDEARPFLFGPRAQKIQQITLPAAMEAPTGPAGF